MTRDSCSLSFGPAFVAACARRDFHPVERFDELLFELSATSELSTSRLKAWRRKLSGPVFSSSRRTR